MINVKKHTKAGLTKDDPEHHCLACGRFNTTHTSHVGTASTENQSPGFYLPWKKTFGKDNPKKANVMNSLFIPLVLTCLFKNASKKAR